MSTQCVTISRLSLPRLLNHVTLIVQSKRCLHKKPSFFVKPSALAGKRSDQKTPSCHIVQVGDPGKNHLTTAKELSKKVRKDQCKRQDPINGHLNNRHIIL